MPVGNVERRQHGDAKCVAALHLVGRRVHLAVDVLRDALHIRFVETALDRVAPPEDLDDYGPLEPVAGHASVNVS